GRDLAHVVLVRVLLADRPAALDADEQQDQDEDADADREQLAPAHDVTLRTAGTATPAGTPGRLRAAARGEVFGFVEERHGNAAPPLARSVQYDPHPGRHCCMAARLHSGGEDASVPKGQPWPNAPSAWRTRRSRCTRWS